MWNTQFLKVFSGTKIFFPQLGHFAAKSSKPPKGVLQNYGEFRFEDLLGHNDATSSSIRKASVSDGAFVGNVYKAKTAADNREELKR
ncbi:MAG: hypothetical protein NWF05_11640 [Candidatus Bathyarchaeota archaeon]|nr:hypothetical protein [Candidatus Bathyarchaeota archaeon]